MKPNPFFPDILTREQVAGLLQLRPSTIDALARRGDIPSIRLGRHRRYVYADLLASINEQRQTS